MARNPIQVINRPMQQQPQQPQSFSSALFQGLGNAVSRIAHNKINQYEERQNLGNIASRIRGAFPDLTQEEATYLATLQPQHQIPLLQQFQNAQNQFQQQYQQPMEQMQPQIPLPGGQPMTPQGQQVPNTGVLSPQLLNQIQQPPQQVQRQSQRRPGLLSGQFNPVDQKEAAALRKEEFKEAIKERTQLKKDSKIAYEDAIKSGKASEDIQTHLDRMEKLVKKGYLPNAAFRKILKKVEDYKSPTIVGTSPAAIAASFAFPVVGSILSSLQDAASGGDIEEFEKLSSDLIRGAKEIFGSRITDADLTAFLKTIPTLDQTDAGKLRVIKNMRQFNQAALLRSNAAKRIIKENGGLLPPNLSELIEDEVGPKLTKISQNIVKGFEDAEKESGSFGNVLNEQLLQGIPLIPGSGIRSLTRP